MNGEMRMNMVNVSQGGGMTYRIISTGFISVGQDSFR